MNLDEYFIETNKVFVNNGNPIVAKKACLLKESNIRIGKGTKIETGAVIYPNCSVGNNCIIGTYAVLKPETHIGNHSIFGALSVTEGNVVIGNWTTIHSQCHITWGMKIGNRVFIAPFFHSSNTPKISLGRFGFPNSTNDPRFGPVIKDGARFGENVGVAPGVIIGKNALIDMKCLITRNVKPNEHIRAGTAIVGKPVVLTERKQNQTE